MKFKPNNMPLISITDFAFTNSCKCLPNKYARTIHRFETWTKLTYRQLSLPKSTSYSQWLCRQENKILYTKQYQTSISGRCVVSLVSTSHRTSWRCWRHTWNWRIVASPNERHFYAKATRATQTSYRPFQLERQSTEVRTKEWTADKLKILQTTREVMGKWLLWTTAE